MKTASPALVTLLNSGDHFYKADLYTWTFIDGSVLRTTSADIALTTGGNTFLSESPIMARTKVTNKVGLEVDSMDVTVSPTIAQTIGGLTWQAASRLGYLDGATVLVETAYLSVWPTVVGTLHVFEGLVSDITPDRGKVKITVKSALENLAQPFPRNVYQSVCRRTIYSPGCGVNKASFTTTGTVVSSPAPTLNSFKTSHAQAAGYFDQGVVAFTSGVNNGIRRTIKSYDPSTGFKFVLPLSVAPSAGDTISVYPGCDKTLATCRTKFTNEIHFRAEPWIPTPEMSTPPVPGGTNKGGKW